MMALFLPCNTITQLNNLEFEQEAAIPKHGQ